MPPARRGTISQHEKATGRAFDRQIGSTKRGDRTADRRIRTGFALDRHICYATGDRNPGNLGLRVARRASYGVKETCQRKPPLVATSCRAYYSYCREWRGDKTIFGVVSDKPSRATLGENHELCSYLADRRRADCSGHPVHEQIAAGRGAAIGSVANAGQSERQYRLAHQFDHRRDAFLQGYDVAHP